MKFNIWREDDFQFDAIRYTISPVNPVLWVENPLTFFYAADDSKELMPLGKKSWKKSVQVVISKEAVAQFPSMLQAESYIKSMIVHHYIDALLNDDELPTHIAKSLANELANALGVVDPEKTLPYSTEIATGSSYANKAKSLAKMFPSLETFRADCPECIIMGNERLYDLIIHINDQHEWTREQIADFLDTLDVDLSIPLPAHVGSDDKFTPPMNVGSEKEE